MKKELGSWGEGIAKDYLIAKGYRIIFTNYKTKMGEIDIVAQKENVVAFVEVKTRRNDSYGKPRESVNFKKQLTYARVAEQFLQQFNNGNNSFRFDVIEVYKSNENFKVEHIEDAFGL